MATIVVKLRGREMKRHAIVSKITRIGRDTTNDVSIDNPGISRVHASVRYQGGRFHVVDEGSVNGIFVNGDEIDDLILADGDEIQIGKFTAVFLDAGGAHPQDLLSGPVGHTTPVNPVETTAISLNDLHKMIDSRREEAGKHDTANVRKPKPPSNPPHRRFDTFVGAPEDTAGEDKTQQLLVVAIGMMGVIVLALAGIVVYLVTKS